MHPHAAAMMALFEGYSKAYGTYQLTGQLEGKKNLGRAYTHKGDLTLEQWHDHLVGKIGLGVIPINENSMVRFAAIDIDQYPLDPKPIVQSIEHYGLPLIPCMTKSEGLHLFMFCHEWVEAKLAQDRMREFAALLGYGDCEIFPKQTKIIVERGDMGQWINMPYFMEQRTKRSMVDRDGQDLPITSFLKIASERSVDRKRLLEVRLPDVESLTGGPPCINHLARQGFPPGTRNNGLFAMGVYAKKVSPDGWQKLVEDYNNRFMDPPLGPVEVLGVIKSLNKKDWTYPCEQAPIKNHCNRDLCRQCEHGIGRAQGGFPRFGTLTKLVTDPPIWFLEVEGGGRLELSTDDLQSPIRFQARCMETLNIMPPILKRDEWTPIIQRLLSDVTIIEIPLEATPVGMLTQYLEDFCTSRVQGKTHDEIIMGKPWTNNGRHYFRMRDFLQFLERNKFKEDLNWIAMHLRDLGADRKFFNIRGRGVNVYSIPEFKNKQTEAFDTPEVKRETPY